MNCIVRIHRTKSATYVNSYKSDGMNSKKYISLEKMEVTPLAPGITESVDNCTKKKRYSLKSDSMKSPTCTILYQTILATIHKSGLYDLTPMAYSQPPTTARVTIGCLFTGGYDIGLSYPQIVPRNSPLGLGYAPLFTGGERENRISYRNKKIISPAAKISSLWHKKTLATLQHSATPHLEALR